MSRRFPLLLPVLLGAIALPAGPALAGENDGDGSGSARLTVAQGCVNGERARVVVRGDDIDSVAVYVDGERVARLTEANAGGGWAFSMRCSRLSFGAHRASAVVSSGGERRALRFQITRARQVSPRFTG
jgi:hypothetical protein